MARVAVVIVTYNSADCIGACLDSLPSSAAYEIVIVDNASSDSTRQIAAARGGIVLIANSENAGFAGAVNQAVRATKAPLVLLLNPDTRAVRGVEHLENEFICSIAGAAGGMLTNPDGTPQTGFMYRRLPTAPALIFEVLGLNRLWPGNPVNWRYRCMDDDPMVASPVEQPAGAFLMFSRAAWTAVGGFNTRFHPVWFEDVDFCARLLRAGFTVHYNPSASAVHEGAHSVKGLLDETRQRYWYGSLLGYAAIHYGPLTYRIVCLAVAVSAVLRAGFRFPGSGIRGLAVYGDVCRLALSRLFRPRRESGSFVV